MRVVVALACLGAALSACRAETQPEPQPEPYRWVVSEAGVGPVAFGMRSEDLQGIVDTLGGVGKCVYARPIESAAPTVASGPGTVAFGFSRKDLLVMFVDGVVARVDVIGASVPTEAGARVGDSEARIRELYPDGRVEPHKYTDGHYLVVDSSPRTRYVFETDGTKVTRYRSGLIPQVDWVEGCS